MGESLEGTFFGFSSVIPSTSSVFGESSRERGTSFSPLLLGDEMSGLVNEGARFLRPKLKLLGS